VQRAVKAFLIVFNDFGEETRIPFFNHDLQFEEEVTGNLGEPIFRVAFLVVQSADAEPWGFQVHVHHQDLSTQPRQTHAQVVERLGASYAPFNRTS